MIVELDGVPIHVHTGGIEPDRSRRPVVLVHGAGMDHSVWRYLTRRLAGAGWAAVAPDLPGHGHSGGSPLADIPAMAEWLARLCEKLELDSPRLVGHSMGSYVVLEMAAGHAVAGLVLLGASSSMAVHPDLQGAADAHVPRAADFVVGWSHSGRTRFGPRADPGLWTMGMSSRLLESGLGSLGSDLRSCSVYDPMPSASTLACPVLVIVAGDDRMTTPADGRRLAAAIAGAEVATVDSGHMSMIDSPREVERLVSSWLVRTDGFSDRSTPPTGSPKAGH